ncbi:acyl-CoA synthetase (AMP-forming)/AMP-acid ligase II [Microbacterium natoriense]|uniref:Acyl-CoA synthetase (AMP-forming)/AMP-acid ligase II n=1 Tax=Microbacterium natoriense TaxID=284570 RepID=A0AAW8EZU9_9MICO|nr:acyl-CoA synthetase (AMP-forming)/AMP-acid ligase II [Microbacterium natoriense]
MIEVGAGAERTEITYGELGKKVDCIAEELAGRYGVCAGDRVALSPSNSISDLAVFCAIVALGATCVMIPGNDPTERQLSKLRATSAKIWFGDRSVLVDGPVRREGIVDLVADAATRIGCSPNVDRAAPHADSPAVIFFTTGSTAAAKAVVQSNRNVLVNCAALADLHRLGPTDRLLGVLPMYYANGLELSLITPLLAGATSVLLREFDPLTYLATCAEHSATVASVVPALLDAIASTRGKPDLRSLRYFVSAAAPLSARTARAIWERLGKQIVQGYGLSETTNFATSLPTDLNEEEYRICVLDAPIPMVGSAIHECEVGVFTLDGSPVRTGERGEVCMRGKSVMLGYDRAPSANSAAFRNGWFRSGDEGFMSFLPGRDEPLLTLTGRYKNIIKVGGVGVSLDEVDRYVQTVSGVADAAALRAEHPVLGEAVSVLFRVHPDVKDPETVRMAILDVLKKQIGLTHAAVTAEVRNEVPRTANGKVLRWGA